MQILPATIVAVGSKANSMAAKIVSYGGILVYPTDTVYGLGCDPMNPMALERLFAAKGRTTKAVPVLCASLSRAQALVDLGPMGLELARRYWPGALTIVAPLARPVPEMLHQGTGSLGVRVPGSSSCLGLVRACGGVLVGTSANLSGNPSARTAWEAMSQLGTRVDLVIDGGRLKGVESTVVKVTGDDIIVLRKGSVGVPRR